MNDENPIFDYTQTIPDRFNPFNNDTENHTYSNDYRKIVPQISTKGCVLPEKPSKAEKKNIRRVYNLTSLVVLIYFGLTSIFNLIFSTLLNGISINVVGSENLKDFLNNSSISLGTSAIVYTITNILSFLIGCKILGIDIKNVFNKPQVKTPQMLKHITTTWGLQGSSITIIMIVALIFFTIFSDDLMNSNIVPSSMTNLSTNHSLTNTIVFLVYGCIVAPITEEMFFRGVVLRGFSVVSQRFGIFVSALFFALVHGNILQGMNAFVIGLYFGFVAVKYNSILPNMLMHVCANLIPFIITSLSSVNMFACAIVIYMFYGTMLILTIVFLCLGIHQKSNRLPIQTYSQRTRTLPILMSSICFIATVIIYLVSMILPIIS
ncbi:MAG: lysostaphin resistance A-like protein [Oscillospiraceae bacterium]